ncbi:hypothetical protein EC991_010028 [Linnemannia zychae]|nr:hypothetical protein EC991_010028 [Linnemannia zychae]
MRTSLFLAVAAALVASASAHEGHDHGDATPSVCLTNPADASCANYSIPAANLTSAISEICTANKFLPGCSLNNACTADKSLNPTYCAPLTVLATLCTAKEDTALTQAVCSKSYSVFCGATSLIPNCKTQVAFPGLPSGKVVTGAVYSVCQEMPGMTDCKICPAPGATGYSDCDEVAAWKGLCLDMPDMTQCPSYNSMCKNTTFAPFCNATYKAPATPPPTTSGAVDPKPSGDHSGHGGQNAAVSLAGSMTLVSALAAIAAGVSAMVL